MRKTYKKKSTAKKKRRKYGRLYKVKDGWRISYAGRKRRR